MPLFLAAEDAASTVAINGFYRSVAILSFTLLGLWWVVLRLRHEEWASDPARRRANYLVSLSFILPGGACLLASVADQGWVWRFAFVSAGVIGVVAMIAFASQVGGGEGALALRLFALAAAALYVVVGLVGVVDDLPDELGLELTAREAEGFVATLLILLGTQITWLQFSRPLENPSSRRMRED